MRRLTDSGVTVWRIFALSGFRAESFPLCETDWYEAFLKGILKSSLRADWITIATFSGKSRSYNKSLDKTVRVIRECCLMIRHEAQSKDLCRQRQYWFLVWLIYTSLWIQSLLVYGAYMTLRSPLSWTGNNPNLLHVHSMCMFTQSWKKSSSSLLSVRLIMETYRMTRYYLFMMTITKRLPKGLQRGLFVVKLSSSFEHRSWNNTRQSFQKLEHSKSSSKPLDLSCNYPSSTNPTSRLISMKNLQEHEPSFYIETGNG